MKQLARILGSRIGAWLYSSDIARAKSIGRSYWIPKPFTEAGALRQVPFIYENPNAPHLKKLSQHFGLPNLIAGARDEYHAMLTLGTWLGSRWDHGEDDVPHHNGDIDLVQVIEEGMRGKKFWCEIAAEVAVQAFSAIGWPARLVSTSRDGRTWEHAVMDVWSNQFGKWFAMDTDFNVVYESDGVPLSAYELCHDGPALQKLGRLGTRLLGEPKPALPATDLLPYYKCIYIDLRSDWYTRKLRRGSPAGGDVASWWTARPDFSGSLAPKIRVDDRQQFDWPVHITWINVEHVEATSKKYAVRGKLHAYSPAFCEFQIALDGGEWLELADETFEVVVDSGSHVLSARVKTLNGDCGVAATVPLVLPPISSAHEFTRHDLHAHA